MELCEPPVEHERGQRLVRVECRLRDLRVGRERIGRGVCALLVEAPVDRRGDRGAVGLDQQEPAAGCKRAVDFVQKTSRIGEMMEDVEHDDVRKGVIGVREVQGVDGFV